MLALEIPAFKRLVRSYEVRMKIRDLIAAEPGAIVRGDGDVVVSGLSYDSRMTTAGDLFFAVQGTFKDGSSYVADALEQGAVAVVSDQDLDVPPQIPLVRVVDGRMAKAHLSSLFYGNPSQKLQCVGITGTNGKTTTSYMIRSILEQNGLVTGLVGTINHVIGKEPLRAQTTTPDAVDIQQFSGGGRENALEAVEPLDQPPEKHGANGIGQMKTEVLRRDRGCGRSVRRQYGPDRGK